MDHVRIVAAADRSRSSPRFDLDNELLCKFSRVRLKRDFVLLSHSQSFALAWSP